MKKVLAVLVALALCAAVPGTVLAEDKPVITMINRLNADYLVEGNPVLQKLQEINGIVLELEAPPINNYPDRLNVVMASGELPDIIYTQSDSGKLPLIQGWVDDGLVLALDKYLDQMPNVKAVMSDSELTVARIYDEAGTTYGIPRVQTKPKDGIIIRKDWLDKLGLQVPKTPEEFAKVMYAFAHNDPDGNGKNDTYGFSVNAKVFFSRNLVYGFGIVPATIKSDDGEFHIMEDQPGFMTYMDWLRSMYEDGSLDPEWYLNKDYEDQDKYNAGKIGVDYKDTASFHIIRAGGVQEANPAMINAAIPPLRQDGAKKAVDYFEPQLWGLWMVNAELEGTDHLNDVLKFLDWGFTDEANELLMLGIQGVTYDTFDPVTRFANKTEEQAANAKKYCASYATFNYQLANKGLLAMTANTPEDANAIITTNGYLDGETDYITYTREDLLPGVPAIQAGLAELKTQRDEMITKYVCGNITRDEFVNFLNNTWIPANQPIVDIIKANIQ